MKVHADVATCPPNPPPVSNHRQAHDRTTESDTDREYAMQTSVVIPTYNRWPVVARAIESVLNQTLQAAQILVVDDGSDDGSGDKLKKRFGTAITLVEQSNHGVSHARNTAINLARGDWIALLDSDDEWLPQKLERQHDAIENADTPVLIHCDEIWVRNGVRVNAAKKHRKRGGFIYEHCLPLCCISPSAAIIDKNTLLALGGFDEQLPACEDYDLWLRLCAQHSVTYIDEPLLIKYGGHVDQLSAKYWGMDRFRLDALEKILASTRLNETQRQQTADMLIQKARIMLKGAIKHNNAAVIERCNQLIEHYDTL